MSKEQAMKNKLTTNTICGIIIVSILGTLLHFVYGWSGQNWIIGLFTPVNESTWEHMKLAFFPTLLFFWAETFLPSWFSFSNCGFRANAVLTATFMIPVIFYTYTGVLGAHYAALDITTFYISIICAFAFRHRFITQGKKPAAPLLSIAAVILTLACFVLFTYHPSSLGIFTVP